MRIISMDDGHVPTHKSHLEAKNCGVISIIGEDELYRITISDPDKPCAKKIVSILVDSPIACEAFSQVRM